MPAQSSKDPRHYVKYQPLPIPSQKGLVIQARSDANYNPTYPTRDEVRHVNYKRRQLQMQQQGFRSLPHKPYEGIGDPFYLDQKRLILHALGQWVEPSRPPSIIPIVRRPQRPPPPSHGQELETSSSDESSDEENGLQAKQTNKAMTPANFVLRRQRKGLNTLNKEVAHGRDMIKNVRLGHGLFQLLRKERKAKNAANEEEDRRQREEMLDNWTRPRGSDSESDSDEDLSEEVDLRQFMVSSIVIEDERTEAATSPQPLTGQDTRSVVFRDTGQTGQMVGLRQPGQDPAQSTISLRVGSSRPSSRSRRKLPAPRPYTPQHCNINSEANVEPDKLALFRQLCALLWILEAMNIAENQVMCPITTCWSLKDVGVCKTAAAKQVIKDRIEGRWKQFKTPTAVRPSGKRFSTFASRYKGVSGGRRLSAHPRGSISSIDPSPNGSQTQLSTSQAMSSTQNINMRRGDTIPEDSETSVRPPESIAETDADEEDFFNKPIFTYLEEAKAAEASQEAAKAASTDDVGSDTSGMSPPPRRRNMSRDSNAQGALGNTTSTQPTSTQPVSSTQLPSQHKKSPHSSSAPPSTSRKRAGSSPIREGGLRISKELQQQILQSINRSEEDPRMHKLANPQEKRSSTTLRAEANPRPKTSQGLMEDMNRFKSNKKGHMSTDMRRQFSEISEEKALVLHDTLEAIERERLRKMENMFVSMPTKGTSLHRALDDMRKKSSTEDESKEKRRRSSTHQKWFLDLTSVIPKNLRENWYFSKILEKLVVYGMVEASKQSAYKFLKVLVGLRDWEICSPDISAAIEFCREKIVEMSTEEYEEWFIQKFPKVIRPQTAPPTGKEKDKPKEKKSGDDPNSNVRATKSAPAAGRRLKSTTSTSIG